MMIAWLCLHGLTLWGCLFSYETSLLATTPRPTSQTPTPPAPTSTAPVRAATPPAPTATLSMAERIIRAQRNLDNNRKTLAEMKAKLESPQNEYQEAEEEFSTVDLEYQAKKERLEQLRKKPADQRLPHEQAKLEELEKELPDLQKKWELLRKRFDLAIVEQKTLQEKVAALTQRIQQEEAALEQLKQGQDSAAKTTDDKTKGTGPVSTASLPTTTAPAATATVPAATGAKTAPPAAGTPLTPVPLVPATTPPGEPKEPAATKPQTPSDEALLRARKEADQRQAALDAARDKSKAINERVQALQQNIQLEKQLQDTAVKKSQAIKELLAQFEAENKKRQQDGASEQERRELLRRIDDLTQDYKINQLDQASSMRRLDELYAELTLLQSEQIAVLQQEAAARQEAESAEQRVATLQNPFSLPNVIEWSLRHGPVILLILIVMWGLYRIVKLSSQRIAQFMAAHGRRGSFQDRENRAKTLVGVFSSTASLLILIGGTMMLLEEVGIPIVPLMGGAALFGLAVAFGAQNLIRDYFSGFMVLLEDQYGINDYVKIGQIEGLVERITLRVTTLRDAQGIAHFIPHGTITAVSNYSHTWSRAWIEIGVSYKEDTDFVVKILSDLAAELRRDDHFGPMILEDAVMLGMDAFADSAVIIKFHIKTKPLMQGNVKREMLRRIKKRFDKLKIEIPFPQRTLHLRPEGPVPVVVSTANDPRAEAA